jgi:2-(1,2-epoxy-1,2-dihydrophenyl)acetyl-CoA isomerase
MSDPGETVITEIQDGILSITLHRPPVNAIDRQMALDLSVAFQQAANDPGVRCVLLAARGENFSAGQDLAEAAAAGEISYQEHLRLTYNPLILQIRRTEKPVLAAIHGSVAGAALGIALACDLRIAAENTRLVVGFLRVGLTPDSGVSSLLPALVGLGRASQLALLNTPVDAQTALEWGLVNRVVASGELTMQAMAWANELKRGPLTTFGLTKRLFNRTILGDLEEALEFEALLQEIAHHTIEHQEGLQAFLEKRSPRFYQD